MVMHFFSASPAEIFSTGAIEWREITFWQSRSSKRPWLCMIDIIECRLFSAEEEKKMTYTKSLSQLNPENRE